MSVNSQYFDDVQVIHSILPSADQRFLTAYLAAAIREQRKEGRARSRDMAGADYFLYLDGDDNKMHWRSFVDQSGHI
jgi:hypothetical protein